MSVLFEPLTLRGVTFPNRVWLAPMCQYSADSRGENTGAINGWHRTHLLSRALGGVGLVMTEATAVTPEGRISPQDLGLWNETQAKALAELVAEVEYFGSVVGVQLAHAGRKASTYAPWRGGKSLPASDSLAWETVAPSALAFGDNTIPREATRDDITDVIASFRAATSLAVRAGVKVIEIHAAHGYLLHQFLSPASNRRTDEYGGDFDGRIRLLLEVAAAVRSELPDSLPLFVRVSATDWVDGESWTADQTVQLVQRLQDVGVDLIDVSSGGNVPDARIPVAPGYQVPFAQRIQNETTVPAAAVGLITEPKQAEDIVATGDATAVLLGRELLRDPYWPRRAARELGADITPAPPLQYARAF